MKCDGPASEGGNAGTPLLSHCRSLRGRVGAKADGRADDTLMRRSRNDKELLSSIGSRLFIGRETRFRF